MKIAVVFFAFLFFVPVFADNSAQWKLIDDNSDMKLYTRAVPNSKIKEVKAEAYIKGTIKEACDILFDRLKHPQYFKYIEHSEVLKRTEKCDWSYNVIDTPMVYDKDYLVKSCEVKNADGSVSVTWEPFTDPKYPEKEKKVRVKINKGYWKFTQAGPDRLKVDYYIYTDPAGSLPLWLKNVANKKAVPDTIKDVENQILKNRSKK